MNVINNGADRGLKAHSPLFASSWMALFLLLKQEFELFRGDQPREHDDEDRRPELTN